MNEPVTLIGLGVLVVSNIGLWIDKVYQGKKQVKISGRNGTSLESLNLKMDAVISSLSLMNTNIAVTSTEISHMKKTCIETRDRYEHRFDKIENKQGGER